MLLVKRRAVSGTEKLGFDLWEPEELCNWREQEGPLGLPGPVEGDVPGHPKCGEFSEAIKAIL